MDARNNRQARRDKKQEKRKHGMRGGSRRHTEHVFNAQKKRIAQHKEGNIPQDQISPQKSDPFSYDRLHPSTVQ